MIPNPFFRAHAQAALGQRGVTGAAGARPDRGPLVMAGAEGASGRIPTASAVASEVINAEVAAHGGPAGGAWAAGACYTL